MLTLTFISADSNYNFTMIIDIELHFTFTLVEFKLLYKEEKKAKSFRFH